MNASHPAKDSRRINALSIAAIFAIALWVRLFWIDHPVLWKDEFFILNYIKLSYAHHLSLFRTTDVHPSGYPVLLKAWTTLFGDGRTGTRALSAVAGALTVPALYLLVKDKLGWGVAILAAALLIVNPIHVHYSREMRNYGLLSMFLMWATYFFYKIQIHHRGRKDIVSVYGIAFAVSLAACFYVHYISVLFFVIFSGLGLAIFLREKDRPSFVASIVAIFIAGLLCLPQSVHMLGYSMQAGSARNDWIAKTTLSVFYHQTAGLYPFYWAIKPILALLYLAGLVLLRQKDRILFYTVMALMVFGPILCAIMGVFKGIYLVRSIQCFVLLSPIPLALLIMKAKQARIVLALAVLAANVAAMAPDYPVVREKNAGPDLKRFIEADSKPGEIVFVDADVKEEVDSLGLFGPNWHEIILTERAEGAKRIQDAYWQCPKCQFRIIMVSTPPIFQEEAKAWDKEITEFARGKHLVSDRKVGNFRMLVVN